MEPIAVGFGGGYIKKPTTSSNFSKSCARFSKKNTSSYKSSMTNRSRVKSQGTKMSDMLDMAKIATAEMRPDELNYFGLLKKHSKFDGRLTLTKKFSKTK